MRCAALAKGQLRMTAILLPWGTLCILLGMSPLSVDLLATTVAFLAAMAVALVETLVRVGTTLLRAATSFGRTTRLVAAAGWFQRGWVGHIFMHVRGHHGHVMLQADQARPWVRHSGLGDKLCQCSDGHLDDSLLSVVVCELGVRFSALALQSLGCGGCKDWCHCLDQNVLVSLADVAALAASTDKGLNECGSNRLHHDCTLSRLS